MRILVLSTWFPYPLRQGSKIRAYHLIRALAKKHEVALISFEDAPVQAEWLDHMRAICSRVEIVRQNPFVRERVKSWLGWLSLQPSSVAAGYSQEMSARVRATVSEWSPDAVLALTFITAPYALEAGQACKVVDVDNLLSPMFYESYLQANDPLKRMRRWLAWWKFQRFERSLFGQFDLCLVVSNRDRQAMLASMPIKPEQVAVTRNGVSMDFDPPGRNGRSEKILIFNGALTYAPNYEAMDYFLREIFPRIKSETPGVKLRITGATDGVRLDTLRRDENVQFTGYLDDVRPAVASSTACVVPLLTGAGTRLKVLEAMALGTPVVSTSKGVEGLEVESGKHVLIGDSPLNFAVQTVRLLKDPALQSALAENAFELAQYKYDWSEIGQSLEESIYRIILSHKN